MMQGEGGQKTQFPTWKKGWISPLEIGDSTAYVHCRRTDGRRVHPFSVHPSVSNHRRRQPNPREKVRAEERPLYNFPSPFSCQDRKSEKKKEEISPLLLPPFYFSSHDFITIRPSFPFTPSAAAAAAAATYVGNFIALRAPPPPPPPP